MRSVSQYLNKKEIEHNHNKQVRQNDIMTKLKDSFSNIDVHKNKDTNKEIFRSLCSEYINVVRNISMPDIQLNLKREAVLVEFRILPHLEYIIRNNILRLGTDWSYTIICGQSNNIFMEEMAKSISSNIKIIVLEHSNLAPRAYSRLLASFEFWNRLIGEKILIYQEDSLIFGTDITPFLKWDYIGAPFWTKDKANCVGNGGLSIRTKKAMMAITKLSNIDTMDFEGIPDAPEDVFFVANMNHYKIGRVAPWDVANQFSSEQFLNRYSWGGHQFWIADPHWTIRITNPKNPLVEFNRFVHFKYRCRNLFHKFILNLREPDSDISYNIIQNVDFIEKKIVLGLHCFDLNTYNDMFKNFLINFGSSFNIVITYHVKNDDIINTYSQYTFIEVPNYGMDIGSKFVVVDYLKKNNIDYSYIFFIHSKSSALKRVEYLAPYIASMKKIHELTNINLNIGAIFHNLWHNANNPLPKDTDFSNFLQYQSKKNIKGWWTNSLYLQDVLMYFNLPQDEYRFNEGNFYILHKDCAEMMFTDKLLYNSLNDSSSFDYQWVKNKCKCNDSIYSAYRKYESKAVCGNNLSFLEKNSGKVNHELRDCMVEHLFERIVMSIVKNKFDKDIFILNKDGHISKAN
jgi:hypothetical protein